MRDRRRSIREAQTAAHRRSGYTLFEVMVTVALMAIVMSGIFLAMSNYTRLSTLGRDEMDRTRLARAILNRIAVDLRSVQFTTEVASEDEDATAGDEIEADDEELIAAIAATAVDVDEAFAFLPAGLYGDSESLVMHVSRPIKDFSLPAANDVDATQLLRTSDILAVRYFLDTSGDVDLLDVLPVDSVQNSRDVGVRGLATQRADRLMIEQLPDFSVDSQAVSELLAPEVNQLQFKYIDGTETYDAWNSSDLGRLPTAVEVTIGFRPRETTDNALSQLRTNQSVDTWRVIVALPLAPPPEPEI